MRHALRYCLLFALFINSASAAVKVSYPKLPKDIAEPLAAYLGAPEPDSKEVWANTAPKRSLSALQALGYYNPKVEVQDTKGGLSVSVDLGPPTLIEAVHFTLQGEANEDSAFGKLRDQLPLKSGQRLVHAEYESSKSGFTNLAISRGYFSAKWLQHQIQVDQEKNRATVSLTFDSGPRSQVGRIRFNNDLFDPDFLDKWIPFEGHPPYNSANIAKLTKSLQQSGYFDSVRVRTLRDEIEDNRVPLRVDLKEKSRYIGRVGVGYATDVGLRGRLSLTRPYINRRGHSVGGDLDISEVYQAFKAYYKIPLSPDPLNHYLKFDFGSRNEDIDDRYSQKRTLSAELHDLTPKRWFRTWFIRWEREAFRLGNESGISTLVIPGVSYSRTKSQGGMRPKRGEKYDLRLSGASQNLLSDIDMVRLALSGKWLNTLRPKHRLLTRLDLGALWSNSFDEVPVSQRFFTGGDRSIRGFRFESISPVNAEGTRTGGRFLTVASVEYEYQFAEKWGVALFADTGNAFDDADESTKTGVGFGLRWLSPVGPVRVDIGYGVSESHTPARLHLSIGPDL